MQLKDTHETQFLLIIKTCGINCARTDSSVDLSREWDGRVGEGDVLGWSCGNADGDCKAYKDYEVIASSLQPKVMILLDTKYVTYYGIYEPCTLRRAVELCRLPIPVAAALQAYSPASRKSTPSIIKSPAGSLGGNRIVVVMKLPLCIHW